MFVYRIAKTENIRDLSGIGARIGGGRWNKKGTGIIYTSESRALATVEFLVHVNFENMPDHISIVKLEIPDTVTPQEISIDDLPPNWQDNPSPPELAEIGTNWAQSNETLLLRVSSAVVEREFNILINPSHPDIKHVSFAQIEEYKFDSRLLK